MQHHLTILAAIAVFSFGAGGAKAESTATSASAPNFTGHRYAKSAHVTLAVARDTALKVQPGEITDQELEKEHGGSGLRYSFDIKGSSGTYEVGVDAKTGKVLERSVEGQRPD
jgi:uncharacterized membrane protein YkoI